MPTRKDDEKHDRAVEDSFPAERSACQQRDRRPARRAPRTSASAPRAGRRQPPQGTPTHERHATETAHQGENEDQPPN